MLQGKILAFWRPPTNSINLLRFATCVSILLHSAKCKNRRLTSGHSKVTRKNFSW